MSPNAQYYRKLGVRFKPLSVETFCDPRYTKALTEGVVRIVQAESPVSTDVVSARLLEMSGIPKSSAKLKARCDYLIKSAKLPHTEQYLSEDDDASSILWSDPQSSESICPFYRIPLPEEKPRKASDIAIQEAARAVIDTSEAQYGIPRESLITETAKALGFARVASNTDCYKLCDKAVAFAFNQGALITDDNGFITPSDTNN